MTATLHNLPSFQDRLVCFSEDKMGFIYQDSSVVRTTEGQWASNIGLKPGDRITGIQTDKPDSDPQPIGTVHLVDDGTIPGFAIDSYRLPGQQSALSKDMVKQMNLIPMESGGLKIRTTPFSKLSQFEKIRRLKRKGGVVMLISRDGGAPSGPSGTIAGPGNTNVNKNPMSVSITEEKPSTTVANTNSSSSGSGFLSCWACRILGCGGDGGKNSAANTELNIGPGTGDVVR